MKEIVSGRPENPIGKRKCRILVVPLDWGLGHAARCIPLIREQLALGNEVIIGGSGLSFTLLKQEFSHLRSVLIRGAKVKIGIANLQFFQFLRYSFLFYRSVWREHKKLEALIDELQLDAIISDNRYGLWSTRVFSILVTHQLRPVFPKYLFWFQPIARRQIKKWAAKFHEIWIPDEAGSSNLTGILNWGFTLRGVLIRHIGLLSRFRNLVPIALEEISAPPDVLAIVSGPEPQRSRFEKLLIQKFTGLPYHVIILQGIPSGSGWKKAHENITLIPHLDAARMLFLLMHSRLIIARGGYSTIMDLRTIQRKAVLVPTPGQTEQEYLCARMQELGYFTCIKQSDFKSIAIRISGDSDNS